LKRIERRVERHEAANRFPLLKCLDRAWRGYLHLMAREADYYTAHEAARVLGLSPARVRQMLRAGELEGERGPSLVEGAPGPWLVPASAVRAYQEGSRAVATDTVAMPREEISPQDEPPSGPDRTGTPTETSERLSEGVGALRDKAEEILAELDLLEGRLEAAEVEQLALRETASRERERAEGLQAELDRVRSRGQAGQRSPWRRLFGG
jgi:hypothetical protein